VNRAALPANETTSAGNILADGREVVQIEARALAALAESLDHQFSAAVELLLATRQRVIVSGMGKSGHIGKKIAATFSSTGTPALFVHPAEAAHGDLGMITAGDLLLILSNSGTTAELRSVVHHARAVGTPIIAITSRAMSPLMQAADIRLLLPDMREACPVNIAPTTSTTMMLALGDALAIAAMRVRGFTRERFQLYHPGGSIGGRLQAVETLMHAGEALPLVDAETPMTEVIIEMTRKSFGITGVLEDGRLIGAITDGDLRRHSADLLAGTARDTMTPGPKVIAAGTMCEDALLLMEELRITALFVTSREDPERPVGVLHIHDFARLRHG
jgi:arabinose-5-phosphate isomerase